MEQLGPQPSIRGGISRTLLQQARKLAPSGRDAVLGALTEPILTEVDTAFATTWVSMDAHMALSDAIRDALDPQQNIEIWTQTMRAVYQTPILAGFVKMLKSLFEVTPGAMIKQGPRIYQHMTRHVGILSFQEHDAHSSEIILRGFPVHRYRFICYVEGLAGCLHGGLSAFGLSGDVVIGDIEEHKGTVRYDVSY